MLRTYLLTLAAPYAVGRFAVFSTGDYVVVIIPGVPVMESFMGILRRKQIRDTNPLGT